MTRSSCRRVAAAAVAAAAVVLCSGVNGTAHQAPARRPERHALLIGVTRYPNLPPRHQLNGPINDVALMRKTLVERFGFDRAHITELAGWPADPARRPTRANIQREFERLAKTVAAGDQVFVMYAGHGSQEPDNDSAGPDEDDGMDEIILPADVGAWDGGAGHVRNAIRDDDIRAWVTGIRNAGAFVWLVFDACQSSTMTRGVVAEQQRVVDADELIPASVLDKVTAATRGKPATETGVVGLASNAGGIAALYAAQTIEPTPEKKLPDDKGPVHGLFTYTLIEILEQSTSPLTYRDLAERVIDRYRALGRVGPTPGFEGGGLDNVVLGSDSAWTGPRLLLGEKDDQGRLQLRAGSIAGMTRGTILAVYPPAGAANSDRVVGHVKITDLDPTSATIEPVAFGQMAAPDPDKLIPNSRTQVVQFDYGDEVLRVAAAANSPQAIVEAVASIAAGTNGLAERAPSLAAADWIVQISGENVVLAPASGWQIDPRRGKADADQAPFLVGKLTSPTLGAALAKNLNAISRARNLMHLAAVPPGATPADVDVEVELIRYASKTDTTGVVVPVEESGRVLRVGDQIAFRLKNTGKQPADVTLLFIDSGYGIEPLFPLRDSQADSRVKPEATVSTIRFDVKADTTGWEQVVAIAVDGSTSPFRADFGFLAQPTLEATRGARGGAADGLQRLLERAMYGQGATRGLGASQVGRHAIRMLAWKTVNAAGEKVRGSAPQLP